MEFYKKLNVPEFETMRTELEAMTKQNVADAVRFWDVEYFEFKNSAPSFYRFIEAHRKVDVRLCRFYLTPPNDVLIPHVDGFSFRRSPLGLNLPVIGSEGSTMDWYSCPDKNFINGNFGFNKIAASRIFDFSKIEKVASTTIDRPTFVRTDVVHGVVNHKDTCRLVLSVRFPFTKDTGQQFDDVMNLKGL